jgi:hypothetical protein
MCPKHTILHTICNIRHRMWNMRYSKLHTADRHERFAYFVNRTLGPQTNGPSGRKHGPDWERVSAPAALGLRVSSKGGLCGEQEDYVRESAKGWAAATYCVRVGKGRLRVRPELAPAANRRSPVGPVGNWAGSSERANAGSRELVAP